MGFVLNELDSRREPGSRRLSCRLGEGISLEASIYAPEAILNQLAPRSLSFLHVAYVAAAQRGQSLDVNIQMSEAEWNAFCFLFIPVVTDYYGLPRVPVRRSALLRGQAPRTAATQSALLFSGGVDSFYSLLKLREAKRSPNFLVCINAGAYWDKAEWMAAFGNLDQIASKFALPMIYLDTNFHVLFQKPHLAAHVLRNINAASLLSGLVSTLFYSTSETFRELSYRESRDTGTLSLIEPLLLMSMQRQDLLTVLFGSETNRISKTEQIMSNSVVQAHLDVCTNSRYQATRGNGPLNCGHCNKCVRTMLTLDAFDAIDLFRSCFPVDAFKLRRAELFEELKASTWILDQDVVKLLAERQAPASPTA